jgi:uncharacterized phage protein gp47/JayE
MATKPPLEIRDDLLRVIKNGLQQIGVDEPDVSPGSDHFILATAVADQVSLGFLNADVLFDAAFPDSATGEDLDRLLDQYGLTRREAAGGSGTITLVSSLTTLVPTGTQLVSATGLRYEVTLGGSYSNGSEIPVSAIDTGTATNLGAGSILTWNNTPAFARSTSEVTQAITGGVEAEDDETARARLLARLRNPPGGGNWQQVAEIVEASDPIVQKAFPYPAANGPGTIHVAVTGYPSEVSKSREVANSKVNGIITSYTLGNLPEHADILVTTVNDVPTDVAFRLTLPVSLNSGDVANAADGGGWLDADPFPYIDGTGAFSYAKVSSVSSSTSFTIQFYGEDATQTDPVAGSTRIQWLDRSTWTVQQATILTSSSSSLSDSGAYLYSFAVTLDKPFAGIAANDWIFPACLHAQDYVDALLEHFALMGPGEKTNAVTLRRRAFRHPRPSSSWASSVDASMLRKLSNAGDEVLAAEFLYRSTTTPALPSIITDPPNILIPRQLAFYPPFPL